MRTYACQSEKETKKDGERPHVVSHSVNSPLTYDVEHVKNKEKGARARAPVTFAIVRVYRSIRESKKLAGMIDVIN